MYGDRVKSVSVRDRPSCTNLGLKVGDEYVGDKVVPCDTGKNGVDLVLVDRVGIFHIFGEDGGFDADVRYIVKLGNDAVPVVGSCKAMGLVDLGAEMAQNEDSWLVWTDEDGANKDFEVFHHLFPWWVIGIKLDNNKVGEGWEMVRTTKTEVTSIGPAHGSIGEF